MGCPIDETPDQDAAEIPREKDPAASPFVLASSYETHGNAHSEVAGICRSRKPPGAERGAQHTLRARLDERRGWDGEFPHSQPAHATGDVVADAHGGDGLDG